MLVAVANTTRNVLHFENPEPLLMKITPLLRGDNMSNNTRVKGGGGDLEMLAKIRVACTWTSC